LRKDSQTDEQRGGQINTARLKIADPTAEPAGSRLGEYDTKVSFISGDN
jgi:hypothetical protein